jgi:hypothetical protein
VRSRTAGERSCTDVETPPKTSAPHIATSGAGTAFPTAALPREALPSVTRANEPASTMVFRPPSGQRPALVGYVGQQGSLADVAAREIFPRLHFDVIFLPVSCETVGYAVDAMDAVVQYEIYYFVASAEWLLSISARYALAELTTHPLCITGEFTSKPHSACVRCPAQSCRTATRSCWTRQCCKPTKS